MRSGRHISTEQFLQKRSVRALVLDFDGVFTDNKVLISANGIESVICDRSDGLAIQTLQRSGFPILVLSTETTPMVRFRSEKLGLNCIHGADDKLSELKSWLCQLGIDQEHTVYVGNDVNDVECMRFVGMPIAVADAFPEALMAAKHALSASGGRGAVREIALAVSASLKRQTKVPSQVESKQRKSGKER